MFLRSTSLEYGGLIEGSESGTVKSDLRRTSARNWKARTKRNGEASFDGSDILGNKEGIQKLAIDQVRPFLRLSYSFSGRDFEKAYMRLPKWFRLVAVLRKENFLLAWDKHYWDGLRRKLPFSKLCALGLRDIFLELMRSFEDPMKLNYPIVLVFSLKSGAEANVSMLASRKEAPVFTYCKAAQNEKYLLFPRYYMNERGTWSGVGPIEAYRPSFNTVTRRDYRLDFLNVPWRSKAPLGVFYGALVTQSRMRLYEEYLRDPNTTTVRISDYPCQKFKDLGFPCLSNGTLPKMGRLSMEDQVKQYKYIINAEGLDGQCADRFPFLLTGGSVVLKQSSNFSEWWYPLLEPYKHFIPIASDWSDLSQKVKWLRSHDNFAEQIGLSARRLIQDHFSWKTSISFVHELILSYSNISNVQEADLRWVEKLGNQVQCYVTQEGQCWGNLYDYKVDDFQERRRRKKWRGRVAAAGVKVEGRPQTLPLHIDTWKFDLQLFLANVGSCMSALDFLANRELTALKANSEDHVLLTKVTAEVLSSAMRGDILFFGPKSNPLGSLVGELVERASNHPSCKGVGFQRGFLQAEMLSVSKYLKKRRSRVVLAILDRNCDSYFLSALRSALKEGAWIIVTDGGAVCSEQFDGIFVKASRGRSIFLNLSKRTTSNSSRDTPLPVTDKSFRLSLWSRAFSGIGHIGEVRMEVRALMNLIHADSSIQHVCEVGFNAGHSAAVILSSKKNVRLTSLDLGILSWSQGMRERIMELFPGRFEYIQGDSSSTLPEFARRAGPENLCDLFLVDGGHTYQRAIEDFRNALDVLRPGGYLFADDHSESFPGVIKAWEEIEQEQLIQTLRCERPSELSYGFNKGWCLGKYKPDEQKAVEKMKIHVATTQCGGDPSDLLELEVLVKSILISANPKELIILHLITDNKLSPTFGRMKRTVELAGHSLEVHNALLLEKGISLFKQCAMDRLALPSLLREESCVIYIDRDSIVLRSLSSLYARACSMKSTLLGAVPNASPWYPKWKHGLGNMGVTYVPQTGIQSGVLTMNLDLMRASDFEAEILSTAKTAPFTTLGDQDVLNYYFANRTEKIDLLDCMYNVRIFRGHTECDCASVSPQSLHHCLTYASVDDAVILHGNRRSFRGEAGAFSQIWRRILGIQVLQGKAKLLSYPSSSTYESTLAWYIEQVSN